MTDNYTRYVHLSDNSIVSQHDGPPDQGLTPTTRWLPGEIVVDRHILSISKVKPGDYQLNAGMYLETDTTVSDLGQPIDLGTIQIQK